MQPKQKAIKDTVANTTRSVFLNRVKKLTLMFSHFRSLGSGAGFKSGKNLPK